MGPADKREGLDWDKPRSIQKAIELCKTAEFDADGALKRSECLVQAWSAGDTAKAGCLTMPSEATSNYTECVADVKGWLGEDGVDLCGKQQFATASRQVACVRKAYYPLYPQRFAAPRLDRLGFHGGAEVV